MLKSFKIFIPSLLILCINIFIPRVQAIENPSAVANNKFGIHIISASKDEASPAADLVNSSGGDWGYITVLIERNDRNKQKWQDFFNYLREKHLIPLVRLATEPSGDFWKRPDDGEEKTWADFLDSLNWPTKNRYVIIYNEPNHANEWGNHVHPESYSQVLNKTIDALKAKNSDFFVLNAGFDAAAPDERPNYADEYLYLKQMNQEVPGIFNKLDGWNSHSYPNPGFIGSVKDTGRRSIRGWEWELEILKEFGVNKKLPVFITETGWKHAEGLNYNNAFPTSTEVAKNFEYAFKSIWTSDQIISITPFLLSYQGFPFDHFSFKRLNSDTTGTGRFPLFYPQYETLIDIPKDSGLPVQINATELTEGEVFKSLAVGEEMIIPLKFKNTGQSIWNDRQTVKLKVIQGWGELGSQEVDLPLEQKIAPGSEYNFNLKVKPTTKGVFKVSLNLFESEKEFDSPALEYMVEVKDPVTLVVKSKLRWKDNFQGDYILTISNAVGRRAEQIILGTDGISKELEAKYVLPDYSFDFTLERPYYFPKTIKRELKSGINELDFGTLEPNIPSAMLKPKQLWQLLPFSR